MTLYPEWLEENKAEVALPERIQKMRAMYGKRDDQVCKNCIHFERHRAGGNWFKCDKSKITGGQGTDWRANWKACGKFEEQKDEGE
jgi:hypothetical protein